VAADADTGADPLAPGGEDPRAALERGRALLGPGPDAHAVLGWAASEYGARLVVASSMSDAVLLHLAAAHLPGIDVVFLDTGLHFPETLAFRDTLAAALPITVVDARPALTVAEQAERHGADLHLRDPGACCRMRKVEVMDLALAPYAAWVTGLRRADSATRRGTRVLEWDGRHGMVKVNPLAAWTDEEVSAYVARHALPEHPLRPAGYLSIGCAPCTVPVAPGADPRSGRWAGLDKTECGLHDRDDPPAVSPSGLAAE
jgi:phosphoadenosine phosphosulfate reductase